MANPSKRYPWIVQMFVPSLDQWFDIDAYSEQLVAQVLIKLARRRAPGTEFRVKRYDSSKDKE